MLKNLIWCIICCVVIVVNRNQLSRKLTVSYFIAAIFSTACYLIFSFTSYTLFALSAKVFYYVAYALLVICLVIMLKNDPLCKRLFSFRKKDSETIKSARGGYL